MAAPPATALAALLAAAVAAAAAATAAATAFLGGSIGASWKQGAGVICLCTARVERGRAGQDSPGSQPGNQ